MISMSEMNKIVADSIGELGKESWNIIIEDEVMGVVEAPEGYDMQEIVDQAKKFAEYKFPDKAVVNFYLNIEKNEIKLWLGTRTKREEWWTL